MKPITAHTPPKTAQREFLLWINHIYPKHPLTMKRRTTSQLPEPTEAEIQHAAYLLWVEDGRPEGRDLEHWLTAKEMLMHRHGRDGKTRRRAPEVAEPAPVG